MDRRRFILSTAAAALYSARPSAWRAASAELGSIDGSVGGNNFTPVQFLDYLSSIKLTWAMISLPAATLRDEPAIRAMVTRIIEDRVADGQFDECDLTLRDLERIREAFVGQLLGMYHTRIAYPQNTVVELESRRAASGGGGAGPSVGSGPAS